MVAYRLAEMHTRFQTVFPQILEPLCKRYPEAPLKRVETFYPKGGDRSMGHALEDTIVFNLFWFRRDPSMLEHAAQHRTLFPLGDGKSLAYHGTMDKEPLHVATHEFGHILAHAHKGWDTLADEWWKEGCAEPERFAPSAYALVNPTEYWAELFAAFELNAHVSPHIDELRVFLGK